MEILGTTRNDEEGDNAGAKIKEGREPLVQTKASKVTGNKLTVCEGDKTTAVTFFDVIYGNNVMPTQMLEAPLLGVGKVLPLERDERSMLK